MIRVLRREEIDAVVPLLRDAYRRDAPYAARLARYLAIEPRGWFVAEVDGELAGMVGVVIHGAAAYLGLMAVHPKQQSRGLGRRLLEHALAFVERRGVGLTMLDASDAGAPLYLSAGFLDRGKTLDLELDGSARSEPVERASIDEVLALDREQLGLDRAPTLRVLSARHPERLVVHRDAQRRVVAYAIAQAITIGPIVATNAESARAVIRAATSLEFDAPPHILAPVEHRELIESQGFRTMRALRHMRRGGPDVAYRVVGKASLAVG